MRRPWHIWVAFGFCAAVALAAMGSVSLTALRLDRTEAEARRQAELEEGVRLALWRMDSAVSPLIAQENARPYFAYQPFYPAERAYTRMFAEIVRGEVLVPSPLLAPPAPPILLHFQLGPQGDLASPQVPTGNMRDLAESGYTTAEKIEAASARLGELRPLAVRAMLLAALPEAKREPAVPTRLPGQPTGKPSSTADPKARGSQEWAARFRQQKQAATEQKLASNVLPPPADVCEGVLRPLWLGETLLLARRVSVGGQDYVQGCWLDWPAIRQSLLAEVADLLPQAALEPASPGPTGRLARMLAALPVRLVPGPLPTAPAPLLSPIRLSLAIAWGCVVMALVAVAALLIGAVSLSERRAAFVSAVTHELRTPLTTFRMYTEMLAEGMVADEAKRARYLATLRTEAERLSHLIENVLAYARLERGRAASRPELLTLGSLLERSEERLVRRAEQGGMSLVVEADDLARAAPVRADAAAVEQILLNLVDNACKYAASATDKRIHLQLAVNETHGTNGTDGTNGSQSSHPSHRSHVSHLFGPAPGLALLRIRDHGPGISRADARRLFRPFSKSARDAASSAPGVGLGLALSRRLARAMGGDLALDPRVDDGAGFVLSLGTGQPTARLIE